MSTKKVIGRVRGTLDKFGLSYQTEKWILTRIKAWLENANFAEIEIPVLEHTQLFTQSIGETTDVVNKELFVIQPRNEESESLCLRPEFTAGIFRFFLENKNSFATPTKLFASGPCFRYERPQKGRYRQFDQVSVEIIDAKSIFYDIDLLLTLDRIFSHEFLLSDYSLKINCIGNFEERANFRLKLVDFLGMVSEQLCDNCNRRRTSNPLRCLDCKVSACQNAFVNAPSILDFLGERSVSDFAKVQDILQLNNVSFIIDKNLVRGLDYYEGLVFEFVSTKLGAQSTFCGGGRYEFSEKIGGDSAVACVGAGIGLTRLCMMVDEQLVSSRNKEKPLFAIIALEDSLLEPAVALLDYLRKNNLRCELLAENSSLKAKLKLANRIMAQKVIFLGPEEVAGNFYTVKDLESGTSEKWNISQFLLTK